VTRATAARSGRFAAGAGAAGLLVSLSLAWASAPEAGWWSYPPLNGIGLGAEPVRVTRSAWQLHTLDDIGLCVLVVVLAVCALRAGRAGLWVAIAGCLAGLGFTIARMISPPRAQTGLLVGSDSPALRRLGAEIHGTWGAGEIVALVALVLSIAGLVVALRPEPAPAAPPQS
jgi:hypothetical protein